MPVDHRSPRFGRPEIKTARMRPRAQGLKVCYLHELR